MFVLCDILVYCSCLNIFSFLKKCRKMSMKVKQEDTNMNLLYLYFNLKMLELSITSK